MFFILWIKIRYANGRFDWWAVGEEWSNELSTNPRTPSHLFHFYQKIISANEENVFQFHEKCQQIFVPKWIHRLTRTLINSMRDENVYTKQKKYRFRMFSIYILLLLCVLPTCTQNYRKYVRRRTVNLWELPWFGNLIETTLFDKFCTFCSSFEKNVDAV